MRVFPYPFYVGNDGIRWENISHDVIVDIDNLWNFSSNRNTVATIGEDEVITTSPHTHNVLTLYLDFSVSHVITLTAEGYDPQETIIEGVA